MVNFRTKNVGLPLYLRNAALSTPIKWSSNSPAYEMRKRRQKKREGKRERNEDKMRDQIAKKQQQKHLHVHTISHHDPLRPAPWPFMSVKIWQCLIVRITYLLSFPSKLCLISFLCWIPEANIQPYPHFDCIFKTLGCSKDMHELSNPVFWEK